MEVTNLQIREKDESSYIATLFTAKHV